MRSIVTDITTIALNCRSQILVNMSDWYDLESIDTFSKDLILAELARKAESNCYRLQIHSLDDRQLLKPLTFHPPHYTLIIFNFDLLLVQ